MKKVILSLIAIGLISPLFAQEIKTEKLSEVVVTAANYKYLNEVGSEEVDVPVELLERKVASYDVKESEFYHDEHGTYYISFYIPEGKILAAYDGDGKIMRTVERFKEINLPSPVLKSVTARFPGWAISKEVYLVNYNEPEGSNKRYKLVLENGDKRIRVKTDEEGNFL